METQMNSQFFAYGFILISRIPPYKLKPDITETEKLLTN